MKIKALLFIAFTTFDTEHFAGIANTASPEYQYGFQQQERVLRRLSEQLKVGFMEFNRMFPQEGRIFY